MQDLGRLSELKDGVTAFLTEGKAVTQACTQERQNQFGKLGVVVQKDKNEMHMSTGLNEERK